MLRCWTEVRTNFLTANLNELRSRLPARCGVISVLKANAYGHGAVSAATALKENSAAFAVACLSEALALRQAIPDRDIFLLGSALPEERPEVVKHGLIATISSVDEAAEYAKYASSHAVRICVKIDTGMGRMGLWKDNIEVGLRAISQLPAIAVHSIATHLPAGDEDPVFSRQQLEWMQNQSPALRKLFPGVLLHALNSAGILEFPQYSFDLVRPGLALYGIASPHRHQHRLKPALSWKTRVIDVRQVGVGRSVSYGRTYITSKPARFATLAVGYADGYPRQLSGNSAYVLIHGRRCPVVGRITMDQTVVDVSELPKVLCGDEVTLIGKDGTEEILASDVAAWANTIAWEILTRIHQRVTRLFA